jgi:hypothetical protein
MEPNLRHFDWPLYEADPLAELLFMALAGGHSASMDRNRIIITGFSGFCSFDFLAVN